jgi:hydroxymethylglutaryl-CoA lyase
MEEKFISTQNKVQLFECLLALHLNRIEITSFVSPKWIPQFKDQNEFCEALLKKNLLDKTTTMAFVPNEKGFENFVRYPIPWCNSFIATSETFNKKNINATIDETTLVLNSLLQLCKKNNRKLRIYISTVFGCPYEGDISTEKLENIFKKVSNLHPDEIALSDTIGVATPGRVKEVLTLFKKYFPLDKTALHLHNTYGFGIANAETAYDLGLKMFDGSIGGIGGCPYAKGASGNLPLDELLYLSFRQKRISNFNSQELQQTFQLLKKLNLKLYSKLFDVLEKGGNLYAL